MGRRALHALQEGVPPKPWHAITTPEQQLMNFQIQSLANSALPSEDVVFEGPEKKLEVYFSRCPTSADGLRQVSMEDLAEMLDMAACSILHHTQNAYFDAYLLSESSCFVFPDRVILKTCGTTTLLLVLPKVLFSLMVVPVGIELTWPACVRSCLSSRRS